MDKVNNVDPMLLPSENPFKCHEVLYLQPMIPPKRFDVSPPLTGGCSEGLDAFRVLLKTTFCCCSISNKKRCFGGLNLRSIPGNITMKYLLLLAARPVWRLIP